MYVIHSRPNYSVCMCSIIHGNRVLIVSAMAKNNVRFSTMSFSLRQSSKSFSVDRMSSAENQSPTIVDLRLSFTIFTRLIARSAACHGQGRQILVHTAEAIKTRGLV